MLEKEKFRLTVYSIPPINILSSGGPAPPLVRGEKGPEMTSLECRAEENAAAPLIRNGSLVPNKLFVVESRISARAGPQNGLSQKERGERYSCMQIIEQPKTARSRASSFSPHIERVSLPFPFIFFPLLCVSTCCVRPACYLSLLDPTV